MNDPFDSPNVPPVVESDNVVIAQVASTFAKHESPIHVASYVVTWAVIFAVLVFHVVRMNFAPIESRLEATKADLLQVSMAAKLKVGIRQISPKDDPKTEISTFDADDFPETHWGEAILLNEVEGADAALSQMKNVERSMDTLALKLTPDQQRLHNILTRLFADYDDGDMSASNVPQSEREFLEERFGWLGTLALTPKVGSDVNVRKKVEQGAVSFIVMMLVVAVAFCLMLLTGVVGLCLVLVRLASKKLACRFENHAENGHLYGETFAVWFVFFTILQLMVGEFIPGDFHLAGAGVAFFASLLALLWPVVRGLTWSDTRKAIGWSSRTNPLYEAICGVGAYICLVPLILAAFVVTFLLMQVLSAGGLVSFVQMDGRNAPSHPIIHELVKNNPVILLTTFFLACVAAPIIEETMFRGVLYRHMRDSTIWFPRLASVAISAGFNSFIFAAIHPQGLLGIPVLTTIALGFSLVREWRDSLIAPMVMHALNNGIATVTFILIVKNL